MRSTQIMLREPAAPTSLPPSDPDDGDLLSRYVHQSDRQALNQLLTRHLDAVYRLARRLGLSAADAEDAVQSACIQVMRFAASYRREGTVRAWIMSITVTECRQKQREEARRLERQDIAASIERPGLLEPAQAAETEELKRRMLDALFQLPEHFRIPLWLHHMEGLNQAEVAIALGVPDSTVRSQISRGMEELKGSLGVASAALPSLIMAVPLEAAPATLHAMLANLTLKGAAAAAVSCPAAHTVAAAKSTSLLGGTAMKITAAVLLAAATTTGAVMFSNKGDSAETGKPAPKNEAGTAGEKTAPRGDLKSLLGSEAFYPSPDRPIGWRGDGTGKFPGATPPTEWSYTRKGPLDRASRYSVRAPANGKDPEGAVELRHGGLRRWLTIGAVPLAEATPEFERKLLATPPDEGVNAAGHTWKTYQSALSGSGVDASAITGSKEISDQTLYLHAWLKASSAGRCRLELWHGEATKVALLVGGKEYPHVGSESFFELAAGWNSVLLRVAVNGAAKDFVFGAGFTSDASYGMEGKNILWIAPMPDVGVASPIVVGDKLIVESNNCDVICLDKKTGKRLWVRSFPSFATLSAEEVSKFGLEGEKANMAKLDELAARSVSDDAVFFSRERSELARHLTQATQSKDPARRNDIGWGGGNCTATPTTDGKSLWVWLGDTGVLACLDLDGKTRWIRFLHPGEAHHGSQCSPLLVGDKLIVEGSQMVVGLDKETGKELWRNKDPNARSYASPIRVDVQGHVAICTPCGTIIDTVNGKTLAACPDRNRWDGESASAVSEGSSLYLVARRGFSAFDLTKAGSGAALPPFGNISMEMLKGEITAIASPVSTDGVVYFSHAGYSPFDPTNGPRVMAMDGKTGALLYDARPDIDSWTQYSPYSGGVSASYILAGGNIYLFENTGSCLLFKPGRTFTPVRKNVFEGDLIISTPYLEGSRIYLRGNRNVFCIGEK